MTNRDPIDSDVVAFAVTDYLCSFRDEAADAKLLAVLVDQGVLNPGEAEGSLVECPDDDPSRVDVFVHDGLTVVMIDDEGDVSDMHL